MGAGLKNLRIDGAFLASDQFTAAAHGVVGSILAAASAGVLKASTSNPRDIDEVAAVIGVAGALCALEHFGKMGRVFERAPFSSLQESAARDGIIH